MSRRRHVACRKSQDTDSTRFQRPRTPYSMHNISKAKAIPPIKPSRQRKTSEKSPSSVTGTIRRRTAQPPITLGAACVAKPHFVIEIRIQSSTEARASHRARLQDGIYRFRARLNLHISIACISPHYPSQSTLSPQLPTATTGRHTTSAMAVSDISSFQQSQFNSSTLEFAPTPAMNGDMDMDMDVDLGADGEISALEAEAMRVVSGSTPSSDMLAGSRLSCVRKF
jgi:hypothetical protein